MKGARLAVAAVVLAASPAGATTKQECAAAYEQTQSLRGEGALSAAREQALICSRDDCPRVVKTDCVTWLGEIERSLPTVVFVVRDERGEEVADVRVTDGGKPLRDKLDGKAVPLDPGAHLLRFEREGSAPVERKVMMHEGDKLVRVEASFGSAEVPAGDASPASAASPRKGGAPVGAYVLGGVGIVGLGVAATFGILALGERGDLQKSCAPGCAEKDVDAVRTKLLVADITGGVSIAALGVATVLLLTAPSAKDEAKKSAAPRLEVGPTVGGAFVGIRGAF